MTIVKAIQDSYRIAIKDLLEFERNRIALMFLFLMPFFMLIMTGLHLPDGQHLLEHPRRARRRGQLRGQPRSSWPSWRR